MAAVFIAVGCSSASPPRRLPAPPPPPTPAPIATPDAGLTVASLPQRGDRCSATEACDGELMCAPLPGGYCTGPCEPGCGTREGGGDSTCVETPRAGELCMKRCDSDRDCRADEGYVCDAYWHACLLPNLPAIVPAVCPAPARDATFAASEQWSTARSPGTNQLEPSAVVTGDGGVTALYRSRASMVDANVLAVSRVDGKGVATLEVPLASERRGRIDPRLARDRKGTLYGVWLGVDAQVGRRDIELATSADHGATWSAPVAVHDPADCVEGTRDCLDKPMVVVGPDPAKRTADMLYVMYAGTQSGLRVRASRDLGKTFGAPVTALSGVYGNANVGTDGKLHLVTINGSPLGGFGAAHHAIEYTSSSNGGVSFGKPVRVSGHEEMLPFYFSNPSIAVDTARKAIYIAYVRGGHDARWDIVLATSRDGGATWKRSKLAGDGCAIHMVPNLALDPKTGRLHVAYYDSSGAPGRFAHASCATGGKKCTQHGAINTVPFALLSTSRHSTKWIGEYQSLVVDAKRRVLHAVWSQVIDEAGSKVSRIFHSSAKLK